MKMLRTAAILICIGGAAAAQDAGTLVERARKAEASGQREAARKDYDAALSADPKNMTALCGRARTTDGDPASWIRDTREAVERFAEQLRKSPEDWNLWSQFCNEGGRAGDAVRRLTYFSAALKALPDNGYVIEAWSRALLDADPKSVLAEYGGWAKTLMPQLPDPKKDAMVDLLLQEAELALRFWDARRAWAATSAAIELNPEKLEAYLLRAESIGSVDRWLGEAKPDLERAVVILDKRLKAGAPEAAVRGQRRDVKARQGDLDGALVDATWLCMKEPGKAEHFVARAVLFERAGHLPEAEGDCGEALKLNPKDERARSLQHYLSWKTGSDKFLAAKSAKNPAAAVPVYKDPVAEAAFRAAGAALARLDLDTAAAFYQKLPDVQGPLGLAVIAVMKGELVQAKLHLLKIADGDGEAWTAALKGLTSTALDRDAAVFKINRVLAASKSPPAPEVVAAFLASTDSAEISLVLSEAEEALNTGQETAAKGIAGRAQGATLDQYDLLVRRGLILIGCNMDGDGLKDLWKALDLQPAALLPVAETLRKEGLALEQKADYRRAIACYREAMGGDGVEPLELQACLRRCYQRIPDSVLESYRKVGAWRDLADLVDGAGKLREAVECWTKAIDAAPKDVELRVRRAEAQSRTGLPLEAILKGLDEAAALDPSSARIERARLEILNTAEEHEQVVARATAALHHPGFRSREDRAAFRHARAIAYAALSRRGDAVQDAVKAIIDHPRDLRPASLAVGLLDMTELINYRRGRAILFWALQHHPDEYMLPVRVTAQHPNGAVRALEYLAKGLSGPAPKAYATIQRVWMMGPTLDEREKAAAVQTLRSTKEQEPLPAPLYVSRSRVWKRLGFADEAKADLATALQLDPHLYTAHEELAKIQFQQAQGGNPELELRAAIECFALPHGASWFGSLQDFDRWLEIEPGNLWSHYRRALLRKQGGDLEGAMSDLTAALKKLPRSFALQQEFVLTQSLLPKASSSEAVFKSLKTFESQDSADPLTVKTVLVARSHLGEVFESADLKKVNLFLEKLPNDPGLLRFRAANLQYDKKYADAEADLLRAGPAYDSPTSWASAMINLYTLWFRNGQPEASRPEFLQKMLACVALVDEKHEKWDPLESTCRHASLSIL